MHKKVSIIGAGVVGCNIAYSLVLKNIADEIALIGLHNEVILAEILDIKHGIETFGEVDIHLGNYSDIENSDLIIITAGKSRNSQETRLDVLRENIKITDTITCNIAKHYKQGIVVMVSNPVDILTYKISQMLPIDRNLILGTGCILDTSRFIFSVADYLGVNIKDVKGYVIGEHGDTQICVWSQTTVNGIQIDEYCRINDIKFDDQDKLNIEKKVINMGADIIRGKGKTHFGISTCVAYISEAILNDEDIMVSVSRYLMGEYGLDNVALSLPCKVNKKGLCDIICCDLSSAEQEKLMFSADSLKNVILNI